MFLIESDQRDCGSLQRLVQLCQFRVIGVAICFLFFHDLGSECDPDIRSNTLNARYIDFSVNAARSDDTVHNGQA